MENAYFWPVDHVRIFVAGILIHAGPNLGPISGIHTDEQKAAFSTPRLGDSLAVSSDTKSKEGQYEEGSLG